MTNKVLNIIIAALTIISVGLSSYIVYSLLGIKNLIMYLAGVGLLSGIVVLFKWRLNK